VKEPPTTFSLGLIFPFSILMTLYEFSKNPRSLIVETAPENRKLMSFSFHSHGLCLWPLNTRSGLSFESSFKTSPASSTIAASSPVSGTGIRW